MSTRVATVVAAGVIAVAAALSAPAIAAAEPPVPEVPVDPTPPPEPTSYLDGLRGGPLAQSGDAAPGIAGLPDLSAFQNELLLGQTATPALPGTDPGAVPIPNALNNSYLLPQNLVPSAPGEGQVFGVDPGDENANVSRREYLHRLYESYRAGGLDGGLLGQRPASELGQPLPPG